MAAPTKQSGWGSIFQQAVAGVEARLDTILAEDDENATKRQAASSHQQPSFVSNISEGTTQTDIPQKHASKANDRLQVRLARALANKPSVPTTTASEDNLPGSDRRESDERLTLIETDGLIKGSDSGNLHSQQAGHDGTITSADPIPASTSNLPLATDKGLSTDEVRTHEVPSHEQNDETRNQIEMIDTLQAKLQYLAKELEDSAKKLLREEPTNSMQRKLAEKDEKIAILLQEGQHLAINEQKTRVIIKRLRVLVQETEKSLRDTVSERDGVLLKVESLQGSASHVENLESQIELSAKSLRVANEEVRTLHHQIRVRDITIQKLENEIQAATDAQGSIAQTAVVSTTDNDGQIKSKLEEEVAALKRENVNVMERTKAQLGDMQKKIDVLQLNVQMTEREKERELKRLESELEASRMQAEEALSKTGSDSQIKLIRQIETLQSQYTTASKNWERIETSLVGRVSSLEKERNEALQRESEMRKKARAAAARSKDDMQALNLKLSQKQHELNDKQRVLDSNTTQLASACKRAEQAESTISQLKTDSEKNSFWKAQSGKSEQERRSWIEDTTGSQSRPTSPHPSLLMRTFSPDMFLLQGIAKNRQTSTPSSLHEGGLESSFGLRRFSGYPANFQPLQIDDDRASPIEMATESPRAQSTTDEDHDIESGLIKGEFSPKQGMMDMLSVSTSAAGPSVQLVERMSAAIRRLEADKMAVREELARVSSQREEARAEISNLLREVEARESASKKVTRLQEELADINSRYQTTLELLGEKSELVEELRADISDLKTMYRELVERTIT